MRYSFPMERRADDNPPSRQSVLSRRMRGAAAVARLIGFTLLTVAFLVGEGKPDFLQKIAHNETVALLMLFLGATAFVIWAVRSARPPGSSTRGFDVIPGPPRETPSK